MHMERNRIKRLLPALNKYAANELNKLQNNKNIEGKKLPKFRSVERNDLAILRSVEGIELAKYRIIEGNNLVKFRDVALQAKKNVNLIQLSGIPILYSHVILAYSD